MARFPPLILGFLLFAAPVLADVIHLKGGGRVEGVIRESGDTLQVTTRYGACSVAKGDVVSIDRVPGLVEKFFEQLAALPAGDAEGRWELAEWARKSNCPGLRRIACERVIETEPDHPEARAVLGHEQVDGVWMPHDDAMAARGYQRVGDRWISPAEAAAMAEAAEREKHARLINRKLDSCVRRMGCGSPTLRTDGRREMKEIAKSENMPRVAGLADEIYEYYNALWKVVAEIQSQSVTVTVIAADAEIKALRTIPINPGSANPTNIQLPWIDLKRVQTTIEIPATPWIPRNWWALRE